MKRKNKMIIIFSSVGLALTLFASAIIILFYKITYDPFDIAAREYITSNSKIIEEYGKIRSIRRNLTNRKVIENDKAEIPYSLLMADGREIRLFVFFEKADNKWKATSYEEIEGSEGYLKNEE